jgi:hypothetical protein
MVIGTGDTNANKIDHPAKITRKAGRRCTLIAFGMKIDARATIDAVQVMPSVTSCTYRGIAHIAHGMIVSTCCAPAIDVNNVSWAACEAFERTAGEAHCVIEIAVEASDDTARECQEGVDVA